MDLFDESNYSDKQLGQQFGRNGLETVLTDPDYNYSDFQTGEGDPPEHALQVDVNGGTVHVTEWSPISESDELLRVTNQTDLAELLDPDANHRNSYSGDTGRDWNDVADFLETNRTRKAVETIRDAAISYIGYEGGNEEQRVTTIERINRGLPDLRDDTDLVTLTGIDRHDLFDNSLGPDITDHILSLHPGYDSFEENALRHKQANRVVQGILADHLDLSHYNQSTDEWDDVIIQTDQHDHKVIIYPETWRSNQLFSQNMDHYNPNLLDHMEDAVWDEIADDPELCKTIEEWLIEEEIHGELPEKAQEFFEEELYPVVREAVTEYDEVVVEEVLNQLNVESYPSLNAVNDLDESEEESTESEEESSTRMSQ